MRADPAAALDRVAGATGPLSTRQFGDRFRGEAPVFRGQRVMPSSPAELVGAVTEFRDRICGQALVSDRGRAPRLCRQSDRARQRSRLTDAIVSSVATAP
jgi:hypothetical protein